MPVTPEMNRLLAEIGALSNAPSVNNGQLARQVLLGAGYEPATLKIQGQQSSSGGPSVVSRIFDILSRPNYAVANYFSTLMKYEKQGVLEPFKHAGEIAGSAIEGLEGQSKKTFSDVLGEQGMPEGAPRAILGLAADIVGDPTTYVGAGAIKGAAKAVGIGSKAAKETPKVLEAVASKAPDISLVPEAKQPGAVISKSAIQPSDIKVAGSVPPVGSAVGAKVGAVPSNVKFSPQAIYDLAKVEVKGAGKHAAAFPAASAEAKDIAAETKNSFVAFMKEAKQRKATREGVPVGPRPKRSDYSSAQDFGKAVTAWKASAKPSMELPAQVERAHDLVARIAQGDIPAAVKASPKPRSTPPPSPAQTAVATSTARQFLSRAKMPEKAMNPVQQLRVFKNLINTTVGDPLSRMTQAVTMLREAEKYYKSQGIVMKNWDGMRLPLSELIDEVGGPTRLSMDDLTKWSKGAYQSASAEIQSAVENIRARSAMEDAPWLKLGLNESLKEASVAEQVMSPAKYQNFQDVVKAQMKDGLQAADVSPGAVTQAQKLLSEIMKAQEGSFQNAFNGNKKAVQATVSGAKGEWQTVNGALSRQLEGAVGKTEKAAGQSMGRENKALEFLGLRFAANYGMKDLRPMQLDYMLSAEANAERRHRVWRELVKNTTPRQRAEAFMVAQGHLGAEGYDAATQAVANQLKTSMERLFSSSGVRDEADSVALRSGMLMGDLNDELRRLGSENYFHNEGSYRNGTDWLKSWESWKVSGDPINQIAKLETAVERVMKKNSLLDEIAQRWGSTTRGGDFQTVIGHPRLDGVYFPRDMAPQINRMLDSMKNMYNPKSPMMKYLDEALSIWKTAVTIYSPAHHIRNAIGDAWLSWIAGVNNPNVYRKAASVMRAQTGRYKSLPELEMLVGKQARARNLRPILSTRSGKQLNADDIYIAAHQRGLLLSARQIEDIFGEPVLRGRVQPFGGRVHDVAASVSENREHFFRLAHFIDAVKKSKAGTLEAVFDDAAHQVRKWHPDGMDMTDFEKKYMKRLFPFYSWSRKALPLVLESIVMKPGKVIAYPKGMAALQEAMGIESPDRGDPFPTDQLFPDWIREKGIGPIGLSGAGGASGFFGDAARQGVDSRTGQPIGGYSIVNPSNPMIDTISQLFGMGDASSALSGVGESLNPGLRIPAELLTGHNVQTQAPITENGQQLADYATQQVPIASILSRLTNVGIGGPTARGEREGLGNLEALINQLTAVGLLGTGPYIKQAQFEQKARTRNGTY